MEKIKLYAFTGFLGSGKTTVLKKLLNNLDGYKVGVLQNEFGKIGIDGEILKKNSNLEMVEINKGSIFCSCLKLSFVEALVELSKKDLDYLFVESSGLADPSNIKEIINATSVATGDVYEFEGAICLVDGLHFSEQIKDLETVERQLKHCNVAVVSKIDLIDDNRYAELVKEIRNVNPVCQIIKSINGNLDLDLLDEDLKSYDWAEAEDSTNTTENKPKTLFIKQEGSIDGRKFHEFLESIKSSCYRMKGFFCIDGKWNQVDVVGSRIDYLPCEDKEISELVIISKIGSAIIKTIFSEWENLFDEKPMLKN